MLQRGGMAWVAYAVASSFGCGAASDPEAWLPHGEQAHVEASPRLQAATGHAIRLSWPAHRGQRGRFRGESEEASLKLLRRPDGSEESESSMKRVVVKGIREVTAVGSGGQALGVLLEIETLTADSGAHRPALQLDRVQVQIERAEREEDAVVTVDGRAADASVREALDSVLSLTVAGTPSDDQIFGTSFRQRIGESWPLQAELARQSLAGELMRLPEGSVSGRMRLLAVDKHASTGIECAEIVGEMVVSPFELVDRPPAATTERAKITVRMRALVPTSAELPRLEDRTTMATEITMSIPGAGRLDVSSRKATHIAYEPL